MHKTRKTLIILVFITFCTDVFPQSNLFDFGLPYIRNYSFREYNGHAQCWQIDQDEDGMLYFGNSRGMLSYDGYKWNLSVLPKRNILRAVKKGEGSRVYVSGVNEFGFMELGMDGSYSYTSLIHKLPENEREVNNIRNIIIKDHKVYFQFYYKLVIYDPVLDQLDYIKPLKSFFKSYLLHNDIYITSASQGLVKLVGDTLEVVPGTEDMAGTVPFPDIVEWNESTWLASTTESLYWYNANGFQRFETEADDFLKTHTIQEVLIAPDKSIIVSTFDNGLVHLSPDGQVLQYYNLQNGLINSTIHSIFFDRDGALWVTTDQGISKLEYHNPIRLFDNRLGIFGTVEVIKVIGNDVYIGAVEGFYKISVQQEHRSVQVLKDKFWTRFVVPYQHNKILVGGAEYVMEFDGKNFKPINSVMNTHYWISPSSKNPHRFYIATSMGFKVIQNEGGEWKEYFAPDRPILSDCRFVQEDVDGTVWLGAADNTLFRITIDPSDPNQYSFKKYDKENGLPVSQINPTVFNGKMHFLSEGGIYEFDNESERFSPSDILKTTLKNDKVMVPRMVQNKDDQLYFTYGYPPNMKTGVMTNQPELREELKVVNSRLMRVEGSSWWTVEADTVKNQIWFGGTSGVVCYSPGNYSGKVNTFYAHISSITLNRDSVLYRNMNVKKFLPKKFFLGHKYNTVRFDFALPYYDDVDNNQFQFMLEGFDEDWSALTKEKYVEYTGLSQGNYTFRVRAQCIYGDWAEEASVEFYVAPPWYLSWWFLAIVSIAVLTVLVWVVRYFSTLKLIKRVEELELLQRVQKERERISSDLHDHVGAQLTSIISGLQMTETIGGTDQSPQFKQLVESLKEDAQVTITHLRDTIWTLKEEEISASEFTEHIQKFAESVLRYKEKPTFSIQNSAFDTIKLNPSVALNLTRVVEEGIHNAIKHAQANHLTISISSTKEEMHIQIKDDGKGFDPHIKTAGEHYGLDNMKRRIEVIGGRISFTSKIDEGLLIDIEYPINGPS